MDQQDTLSFGSALPMELGEWHCCGLHALPAWCGSLLLLYARHAMSQRTVQVEVDRGAHLSLLERVPSLLHHRLQPMVLTLAQRGLEHQQTGLLFPLRGHPWQSRARAAWIVQVHHRDWRYPRYSPRETHLRRDGYGFKEESDLQAKIGRDEPQFGKLSSRTNRVCKATQRGAFPHIWLR